MMAKIYSKTGKGARALSSKSRQLSANTLKILSRIDSKTDTATIMEEFKKLSEDAFCELLSQLENDGYIRSLNTPEWDLGDDHFDYRTGVVVDELSAEEFFAIVTEPEPGADDKAAKEQVQEAAADKVNEEPTAREIAEMEARLNAERKVQEEEEARRKAEAEARARADEAARLEAKRKAREEKGAHRKAAAKARAKAEETAKQEADRIVREEAERKAHEEEEVRRQAEARARAEEAARLEAERKTQEEAERRIRKEEEACRKAEAEAQAKAEKTASLKAERIAREEAKRKAQEEEEARYKAEAEARARTDEAARLEAERKTQEEAERRIRKEEEARRKAEAEAQAKAEKTASLKAERIAREEAKRKAREEKEARRKAAAEARAEAEEKARQKAEHKAREKAERRAGKKVRAKTMRGTEKFGKWPAMVAKTFFIYTPLALAVLVGLLHFVNLGVLAEPIEKLASDAIGEPVAISKVRASLFPQPHLTLSGIAVGADADIEVGSIQVSPTALTLFDEVKTLKSLEIEQLAVDATSLGRQMQWISTSARTGKLKIEQISLKKISFRVPGLDLAPFDGKIGLLPSGEFSMIELNSTDQNLTLQLTPQNGSYRVALSASNWQPPLGTHLQFSELSATGIADKNQVRFSRIEGRIYGGTFGAKGVIEWSAQPAASGSFELEKVRLPLALPSMRSSASIDGTLKASASFASRADEVGKLAEAAEINATFMAQDGKINGVDLANHMISGSSSDNSTRFDKLTGKLQFRSGHYQYRQLVLDAPQFHARGNLDIQSNQDITGVVSAELAVPSRRIKSNLSLGGKVGGVRLK